MKQLTVELPGREYDILIGTGLLEQCGARIRAVTRAERLAVVTDSNVGPLYLKMVMESLLRAGFTKVSVVSTGQAGSFSAVDIFSIAKPSFFSQLFPFGNYSTK